MIPIYLNIIELICDFNEAVKLETLLERGHAILGEIQKIDNNATPLKAAIYRLFIEYHLRYSMNKWHYKDEGENLVKEYASKAIEILKTSYLNFCFFDITAAKYEVENILRS